MTDKTATSIGVLMRCYEALHNWKALVLLSGGIVLGLGLMAAGSAAAAMIGIKVSGFLGVVAELLFLLLALMVYLGGINGAGLLLVDQADRQPGRGFGAAFFGGLYAALVSFVAMLLLTIGLLLVIAALYLLSLLGHIPGIGPTFAFLLAGPSALILAFCYGVLVLGTPLLLVAVWRGEGILGSIGRAVDIMLKRPLDALLHFMLLLLIIMPIAAFVFLLMAATSGASMMMYSLGGGLGSMFGGGYGSPMETLAGGMLSGLNQLGAASASIGIVLAVLVALFTLVSMFGYIMVYDSLGTDVSSSSASRLRGGLSQLKQKVEQNRPLRTSAPQSAAADTDHHGQTCKSCGAAMNSDDQFCGECGQHI